MDLGLSGKTAVVLGSTQGIGRKIARELGKEGCRIVVSSRNSARVQATVDEFRQAGYETMGHAADMTVRAQLEGLFNSVRENYGECDILVYNNGGPSNSSFEEARDDEYHAAYQLMVMGFVWCVKEVETGMRNRKWGRIVTVGSMAAKEPHRRAPLVLHNITRAAALALSKNLANDLGKFGITVNTIGTGSFDGEEGGSFRRTYRELAAKIGATPEEIFASRAAENPTGRHGDPTEIAWLCAFLCSERAAFINGQLALIDGGHVRTLF